MKREVQVTKIGGHKSPLVEMIAKCSCWLRLKRAVAILQKFCLWLQNSSAVKKRVVGKDVKKAELAIVRFVQLETFGDEYLDLKESKSVSKSSVIYSLEPTLTSEELLVIGGRLKFAPLCHESKYPLIIPRDHHVAELIIRYVHETTTGHSGREHVISEVRKNFWIPGLRPMVKKMLKSCVTCRKVRQVPGSQRVADLPSFRVTPTNRPFERIGVDCFGPFIVKRGRASVKRYGCVFTCLVMRAIHLEKLDNLDADSFINGLIRFSARRGSPVYIRSDNGGNFVAGNRELKAAIVEVQESDKIHHYLAQREIDWEFNTPYASSHGGVWERQIRTVRKVLNSIIKDEVLTDEGLNTLFCEVEDVVNGRPITPVSDDPSDLQALTPNQLLKLESSHIAPVNGNKYGRRWRQVQHLVSSFCSRWTKEYLPLLRSRKPKEIQERRNFRIGDMCWYLVVKWSETSGR